MADRLTAETNGAGSLASLKSALDEIVEEAGTNGDAGRAEQLTGVMSAAETNGGAGKEEDFPAEETRTDNEEAGSNGLSAAAGSATELQTSNGTTDSAAGNTPGNFPASLPPPPPREKRWRKDDVIVTYAFDPGNFFVRRKSSELTLAKIYREIDDLIQKRELDTPTKRAGGDGGVTNGVVGHCVHYNGGDVDPLPEEEEEEEEEDSMMLYDNIRRLYQYDLSIGIWVLARCRALDGILCQRPPPLHRAKILEVYFNPILGPHLKVQFIDYGREEWVHMEDVRRMPDILYSTSELALHCRLFHFHPFALVTSSSCDVTEDMIGWTEEAKTTFAELIRDNDLTLHVMHKNGPEEPADVDLTFEVSTGSGVDVDGPTSVRDVMLFQQLGCLVDPRSLPKVPACEYVAPPNFHQMHLGRGSFLTVHVTHVISPDEMYVQPTSLAGPGKARPVYSELQTRLNNYYRDRDVQFRYEVRDPIVNTLCAVRSRRDNKFHRCRVEKVPQGTQLAQVFMVDIGFREVVGSRDMFYLSEDDFLAPYPYAYSVSVHLDRLAPTCTRHGWSSNTLSFLRSLVGQTVLMYVCDESSSPAAVPADFSPAAVPAIDSSPVAFAGNDFMREQAEGVPVVLIECPSHWLREIGGQVTALTCVNGGLVERGLANPILDDAGDQAAGSEEEVKEVPAKFQRRVVIENCAQNCVHPKEGFTQPFILDWIDEFGCFSNEE